MEVVSCFYNTGMLACCAEWHMCLLCRPVMCPSHVCQVRVTIPSSQSHDLVESESSHENCRVTWSYWFASSSQCRVTQNFTFFLQFFAMKWRPIS